MFRRRGLKMISWLHDEFLEMRLSGVAARVMFAIVSVAALFSLPRIQAQTFTTLYSFTGQKDGGVPYAGLITDEAGDLYGTTSTAGAYGSGTVFELKKNGRMVVLHSFTGGRDGGTPYAALVRDAAGNLYGTTLSGGRHGDGTVFKIDAQGKETVLHSFSQASGNGESPVAGLFRDKSGNLFGTTQIGGNFGVCPPPGCGTAFRLNLANKEHSLSFNSTDGATPYAGLIEDAEGNLYGTTTDRNGSSQGTVFKIDKTFRLTVLYRFSGSTDGSYPDASLVKIRPETCMVPPTWAALPAGERSLKLTKLDRKQYSTALRIIQTEHSPIPPWCLMHKEISMGPP
jgi:uncharacterized repeat protein (TIGR03803 family)